MEVARAAGFHSGVDQTLSACHAVKEELLWEKRDPGPSGGSEDSMLPKEQPRPTPPCLMAPVAPVTLSSPVVTLVLSCPRAEGQVDEEK